MPAHHHVGLCQMLLAKRLYLHHSADSGLPTLVMLWPSTLLHFLHGTNHHYIYLNY